VSVPSVKSGEGEGKELGSEKGKGLGSGILFYEQGKGVFILRSGRCWMWVMY
jgi:hypothetical protein